MVIETSRPIARVAKELGINEGTLGNWVHEQYVPSIVKMCIWMEVSRSGFYDWRSAPESATAKRRGILALYVKKSFEDSGGTYGYRRVHTDLVAWGVPGWAGAGAVADA